MKNLKQNLLSALAVVLLIGGSVAFNGCNKEKDTDGRIGSNVTGANDPDYSTAFEADLISYNVPEDGGYAWTWEINRNAPGQKQALSHFDFINGFLCDDENNEDKLSDHVTGAYYSKDGGNTWTDNGVNWGNDPSTDDCYIGDVLKINAGEDNLLIKLILDDEFETANQLAVYKTGGQVKCGLIEFVGVGCPLDPPVQPCWKGETAYGGSSAGAGNAWWFVFDTNGDDVQPIYAGQNLIDGAYVTYSNGNFVITLDNSIMKLNQDNDESVKVQGYNTLPDKRPASGLFTLYKGTSLTFDGDGSTYYVIHLDVLVKQDCE
jgi:hypothetical protein